jgi:hypothetical protein
MEVTLDFKIACKIVYDSKQYLKIRVGPFQGTKERDSRVTAAR